MPGVKGRERALVTMPYPFTAEGLTQAWTTAVGPHTRLAIVDHISADTAIVFPLAEIASALKRQGIAVLGDGAHAPASIVRTFRRWAWLAWEPPQVGVDPAQQRRPVGGARAAWRASIRP
jgi:hypothetical protein